MVVASLRETTVAVDSEVTISFYTFHFDYKSKIVKDRKLERHFKLRSLHSDDSISLA